MLPDHPDIAQTLRDGYPHGYSALLECSSCDGAIDVNAYEIDDRWVCEECFREWLEDYAATNSPDIARALNVEVMAG